MKIYNIDRESDAGYAKYKALLRTDSALFIAVEREFDDYMDCREGSEIHAMYNEPLEEFGDTTYLSKKGAIQQAIEQIFDVMDEYKLPFIYLNDNRIDLESAFQD